MMTQWHEFLTAQGAVIADNEVVSFGNPQAELQAAAAGNVLLDLSHLGLLQVSGEDAATFLQGQVTNDVKLLDGNSSHYSGYCNPKGRLLALFLALAHFDHIHLQLDGRLIEPIMKRLKMFVLRSKVTITDESDNIVRFGVAGKNAENALRAIFTQVPRLDYELVTLEQGALLRLPGPVARYQVYSKIEHAPAIWDQLKQNGYQPAGKASWEWLEIQAGIPDIVPATQEAFVPQMVNLDALGGINFKKGCYTGQEIVARTHYLGKVKRRTQLAHIASSQAPQAGDDVSDADGNEAGKIVRSAASPLGGFDVLAEIRLESLEAGKVQWKNTELVIQELPYSLANL
jgi:folate-binding protein YgfZ